MTDPVAHGILRINPAEGDGWVGTLDWGGYTYTLRGTVRRGPQGHPELAISVGPVLSCHPAMLLPGEPGYQPEIAEAAPYRNKKKPQRFPLEQIRKAERKPKKNRSVLR